MSYFTEESTLGMLIENPINEDGNRLLDNGYEELTRWEKIKKYIILGITRTLLSFTIISGIILLLTTIRLISWLNMEPDKLAAYQIAFKELVGYDLNVWWFILIEFVGWFSVVLAITIPLKLFRLIFSFIYYRKRL